MTVTNGALSIFWILSLAICPKILNRPKTSWNVFPAGSHTPTLQSLSLPSASSFAIWTTFPMQKQSEHTITKSVLPSSR